MDMRRLKPIIAYQGMRQAIAELCLPYPHHQALALGHTVVKPRALWAGGARSSRAARFDIAGCAG
jgi:hypothetical protein